MDTKLTIKADRKLGYICSILFLVGLAILLVALQPVVQEWTRDHFWQESDQINHETLIMKQIIFIILGIVVCLGLVLPGIRFLHIGERKIFRLPFEIMCVLFCLYIKNFIEVMECINPIEIRKYFNMIIFLDDVEEEMIEIMVEITHICMWFFLFLFLYWLIVSLRAVFTMGILNYIKNRVILYRLGSFLKKRLQMVWKKLYTGFIKLYHLFESVDLREKSDQIIFRVVCVHFIVLSIICCFWFIGIGILVIYSFLLFFFLKRYFSQLDEKYKVLLSVMNEMAEGNLDIVMVENLGVFEPFRDEIQKIQFGFRSAVEEEVKSQNMKTELITNVSHDLKTPLTAIITYVNLLSKEDITEEDRRNYIAVLESKSIRLKQLIEDLFEISKANSKNASLELQDLDVLCLLKEVSVELSDKIESSEIEFRWDFPEERIVLSLDSQKMYRVFENLMMNIIKYAMPKSRAYITVEKLEDRVCISMKNISRDELKTQAHHLAERFVRGDTSRNTEGSGLGLAIVKSFVELQGGTVEIITDADLFKVYIVFHA